MAGFFDWLQAEQSAGVVSYYDTGEGGFYYTGHGEDRTRIGGQDTAYDTGLSTLQDFFTHAQSTFGAAGLEYGDPGGPWGAGRRVTVDGVDYQRIGYDGDYASPKVREALATVGVTDPSRLVVQNNEYGPLLRWDVWSALSPIRAAEQAAGEDLLDQPTFLLAIVGGFAALFGAIASAVTVAAETAADAAAATIAPAAELATVADITPALELAAPTLEAAPVIAETIPALAAPAVELAPVVVSAAPIVETSAMSSLLAPITVAALTLPTMTDISAGLASTGDGPLDQEELRRQAEAATSAPEVELAPVSVTASPIVAESGLSSMLAPLTVATVAADLVAPLPAVQLQPMTVTASPIVDEPIAAPVTAAVAAVVASITAAVAASAPLPQVQLEAVKVTASPIVDEPITAPVTAAVAAVVASITAAVTSPLVTVPDVQGAPLDTEPEPATTSPLQTEADPKATPLDAPSSSPVIPKTLTDVAKAVATTAVKALTGSGTGAKPGSGAAAPGTVTIASSNALLGLALLAALVYEAKKRKR